MTGSSGVLMRFKGEVLIIILGRIKSGDLLSLQRALLSVALLSLVSRLTLSWLGGFAHLLLSNPEKLARKVLYPLG